MSNTVQVGEFEIVAEEAVAAGVRRITALTGRKARSYMVQTEAALAEAADCLNVAATEVRAAANGLVEHVRALRKSLSGGGTAPGRAPPPGGATGESSTAARMPAKAMLAETARILNVAPFDVPKRLSALKAEAEQLQQQLEQRQAVGPVSANQLIGSARQLHGARLVIAETPGASAAVMRQLIDQIRRQAAPVAVLLASCEGQNKVTIVAGVSTDLQQRGADAGQWVRAVAPIVGGGGGGRPDMAQAGGKRPEQLAAALDVAQQTIADMIRVP